MINRLVIKTQNMISHPCTFQVCESIISRTSLCIKLKTGLFQLSDQSWPKSCLSWFSPSYFPV